MNKDLIKFLQEKQTPGQWLAIANKFGLSGTNKQKSDKVRRLWKKHRLSYTITGSSSNGVLNVNSITSTYIMSSEELERLQWKHNVLNPAVKQISKREGFHLVLGCVHVPFHNKVLLRKLLNMIEDQKDNILGFHLIGDFLDLKSLSSFDDKVVETSGLTLGKEYAEGNKVLDLFEAVLPKNIQKTFIYGNHEARYLKHISSIKNYKTADAISSPEQALNLEQRGYQILTDWKDDFITIGKYQVFHGIACTTNSAKTHVDKLRASCMFAHTHRIGQHYEGWLHGVNIGCLAQMDSETFTYLSRVEKSQWKNGFGIINISGDKSQAEVIVCEDNGFFYNGKKY